MKNLRSLLERFTKSLNKDAVTKGAVIDVVRQRIGITLSEENISLKEGILTITAGAALKNELRLKEEAIKDELKEVYGVIATRVIYK